MLDCTCHWRERKADSLLRGSRVGFGSMLKLRQQEGSGVQVEECVSNMALLHDPDDLHTSRRRSGCLLQQHDCDILLCEAHVGASEGVCQLECDATVADQHHAPRLLQPRLELGHGVCVAQCDDVRAVCHSLQHLSSQQGTA